MPTTTIFDPRKRSIYLPIIVRSRQGQQRDLLALLDTGAPATEFSDEALRYLGYLDAKPETVSMAPGLQTQKYGKVTLPYLEICSHRVTDLEVYVSHFEKSWGIKALIGLDFFRRCRVTIDYQKGCIITEPFTP